MARRRKKIAEGGTAPHAGRCPHCAAPVIFHRREAGTLMLDFAPVPAVAVWPDVAQRFVLFAGVAIPDPDPRNVPAGMAFYRKHVCAPETPADG